jgi:pimeloyl-ACP methyl ester carboxylesterase
VKVDGLEVTYTPAGHSAVVALHGAGHGTRDSSPLYTQLHELLPPRGIGVATFDRRGEGASEGEITRGRFDAQARDALTVARSLGVGRVGLWGYSQGGWVAPLAATFADDVAFVVTVGASHVSPGEQMFYANRRQLELAGFDPAPGLRLRRAFDEWVHDRGPAPDLAAARSEPWFDVLHLPHALLDDEGKRRWIEEMDFDPGPVFASVSAPLVHFYGERDSWTPPPPQLPNVYVVPDAEHDMTLPSGEISPLYVRLLLEEGVVV